MCRTIILPVVLYGCETWLLTVREERRRTNIRRMISWLHEVQYMSYCSVTELWPSTVQFDIHGFVHRRLLNRNTKKMQLCNRIYYSKVYWRLNMFRAAHRSLSGALNCICSLWFICPCGDRPLPRLSGSFPLSLGNGRSPHGYINQRLQIQFKTPDDERCAARNMLSFQ
jgi:hypothetical protein